MALFLRNTEILLNRLHNVGGPARVRQRLASILLELAVRHGTRDQTGIAIGPTVTREDLAALTGTTLYTVSRVFAAWERQGLIVSRRGRLHVIAPSRFRELASGERSAHAPEMIRLSQPDHSLDETPDNQGAAS